MTSVDERMSSADSGAELPRDMLSAGASVLALRIPRRLAVKHDTIQHHSAASPFTYTPFEGRNERHCQVGMAERMFCLHLI